jgi:hypothetical protein
MHYLGLNLKKRFFSLPVLCGLVFLAAGTRVTQAQASTSDVSVQLSAVSSNAVIGEPILLRCVIDNSTESVTTLQTGPGDDTWYSVSVTDAGGQTVADAVESRSLFLSAAYTGSKVVSASSSYTKTLVLKPSVGLSIPGKYTVLIKVRLPYTLSELQGHTLSTASLSQDFSIPILILATDHHKLQNYAAALVGSLENNSRVEGADDQVRTLFSMPEADALQSWQQLSHNTNLDVSVRAAIPRLLFHIHSISVCDILLDMSQDPAQGMVIQNLAALYLDRLYRGGSDIQKHHIETVFAARGLTIPANPLISTD